MRKITIDSSAGFCPGLIRAIQKAEKHLKKDHVFYSLGSLLHNELEMGRLREKGLRVAAHGDLEALGGRKVLIRAHGEPPDTFAEAKQYGIELIDATCGVVRRLQQKVARAEEEMEKINGQVVIFGKPGHPELLGLVGYSSGQAIVVSGEDISEVDPGRPVRLFSQTTMDGDMYDKIAAMIRERMMKLHASPDFVKYDTICKYVSRRERLLREFASRYDVIIFVSGKDSSNGKILFDVCKAVNPHTFFISGIEEIRREWFGNAENVGISGSASTPQWLMDKVAEKISEIA